MSTFLTVVLVILAIPALLGLIVVLWLRSKVRKAKPYLIYGGLGMVIEAMKELAAKPEHADDQELIAHLSLAETALASAKAALDKDNLDEAVKIMLPVIEELAKYKSALDQESARQAAQAAAENPALLDHVQVIDVDEVVTPPMALLSAPTDTHVAATVAAHIDTIDGVVESKQEDGKK